MRVRLKDIAQKAGVTISAVSKAMRNSPDISQAQCKRIQKLAQKMGYTPDPRLSALSAYRKKEQPQQWQETIAFLYSGNGKTIQDWAWNRLRKDVIASLTKHANSMGYRVDFFDINDGRTSDDSLSKILKNRGIRAVLIHTAPRQVSKLQLSWADFCAVCLFDNSRQNPLHRVRTNLYHSITTALEHAVKCESHNTAVILNHNEFDRIGTEALGAFHAFKALNPNEQLTVFSSADFLKQPQPLLSEAPAFDFVICSNKKWLYQTIRKKGLSNYKLPSVIGLNVAADGSEGRGIHQRADFAVERAINLLDRELQHNRLGTPKYPIDLQVCGSWVE